MAVTITGLGPILYPVLITALLSYYGVNGCVLILAAISLHITLAALLLQPIKYHLIDKTADEELADLNDTKECHKNNSWCDFFPHKCSLSINSFLTADATRKPMETIPNTTEEKTLVEKMNQSERYHFYGFDNLMDETTNGSYENGNAKSSGSNGLQNIAGSGNTDIVPKQEANLKNV